MPRYRVYVTEQGQSIRAVSYDYVVSDADTARSAYFTNEPPDDMSVDDYDFDIQHYTIEEVQLIND